MKCNKLIVSASAAVLAVASGIALAGPIADTYSEVAPTQALDGTKMNANLTHLKDAVNGIADNTLTSTLRTEVNKITGLEGTVNTLNTTTVPAIQADVNNLKAGVPGTACTGNNASDEMVRVGPICVDKYKASLWPDKNAGGSQVTTVPGGCATDGAGAGCAGIVAQSRASVTPIDGSLITWAQAQRACTNAGKRLLTPGEWMAAYSSGLATGMSTVDKQEYVDLVALTFDAPSATKMQVGYVGVTSTSGGVNAESNKFEYDQVAGVANIFNFRCAR
jgi:hypothetical protein